MLIDSDCERACHYSLAQKGNSLFCYDSKLSETRQRPRAMLPDNYLKSEVSGYSKHIWKLIECALKERICLMLRLAIELDEIVVTVGFAIL